ncbi:MAG: DUF3153 domain-containing protein [Clostridia bacterium]|jgi:hypothetical protein
MKLRKLLPLIFLCAVVAVISTGCVKYNMEIKVNIDSSADITLELMLNKLLAGESSGLSGGIMGRMNMDEIKKDAEKQGYKVTGKTEADMTGYVLTKHFNSIRELSNSVADNPDLGVVMKSKDSKSGLFSVKKGFIQDTYTVNFDMDLTKVAAQSKEMDQYLDSFTKTLMASMDFRFKISLPGNTAGNNATTVTDGGKTLEWKLAFGKLNKINAEFTTWNKNAVVLLVCAIFLIIVLLSGLIFIVRFKARMRKKISELELYAANDNMPEDTQNIDGQDTQSGIEAPDGSGKTDTEAISEPKNTDV